MDDIIENYRDNVFETFRGYKRLAEEALKQVSDDEFFHQLDDESNSIAVLVKHIAGNQESRFTDFLTTDGEKSDRYRDSEFITDNESRKDLMNKWENGWLKVLRAVENLKARDFTGSVFIRGERHSIPEALNRQLTHYAYHIGQIVFLAKHYRSADWDTLSVPKNKSAEFNDFLREKKARGEVATHPLDGPGEFVRRRKKGS